MKKVMRKGIVLLLLCNMHSSFPMVSRAFQRLVPVAVAAAKNRAVAAIIAASLISVYHFCIMSEGYNHRVFPHTFTFGIICSSLLWYFTSLSIAIFGFIFFCSHLVLDINHYWGIKDVLEYDAQVLSGDFKAIFKREK